MEDFKYIKNKEKHNPYGSVYDVYLNDRIVGYVKRGPSAPTYFDAWRAFVNGEKASSGSREKAVKKAYERSNK